MFFVLKWTVGFFVLIKSPPHFLGEFYEPWVYEGSVHAQTSIENPYGQCTLDCKHTYD